MQELTQTPTKRDHLIALCNEVHPHYYHETCGSINILLSGYAAICQDQVLALAEIRQIAHHYLDHSMGIHFVLNMEPVTHGFIQSVVRAIQGPNKDPKSTALQSLYAVVGKLGRLIDATNDPEQWLAAVYSFQNDVWAEIVEYWIGAVSNFPNPYTQQQLSKIYATASTDELLRSLYHYHGAFYLYQAQEREFRHILYNYETNMYAIPNRMLQAICVDVGNKAHAKREHSIARRMMSQCTRQLAVDLMAFFDRIAAKSQDDVVHLYEQHPLIPARRIALPLYRAMSDPNIRLQEVRAAIGDFSRAITRHAEECYSETLEYRGVKNA